MTLQFPFGQPLRRVEQPEDQRTPDKRAFVLGVYSSAVHAKWTGEDGDELVKALAVASEPSIFWRGEGCGEVVEAIPVPKGCGSLSPAAGEYNGPSSARLDTDILARIDNLDRTNTWLCDLLPESRANCQQLAAIYREYVPRMKRFDLPVPTVPVEPDLKRLRLSDDRLAEILSEIMASRAPLLILLGDDPIRLFLKRLVGRWSTLSDFGETPETYGRAHSVALPGLRSDLCVLPLTHPRQIGQFGRHSPKWTALHAGWRMR